MAPPGLAAVPTHGVRVPVGTSRTIDVQLFSAADAGTWFVEAVDIRSLLGEPERLEFALSPQTGSNGDTLKLTITATAGGPLGGAPFALYSGQGAIVSQVWFGFVQN